MLIAEKIEKVFAEIGIDKSELVPDASLKSGLGIDSTEMVELLVALEKEFGKKIPDGVITGASTVRDITDYLSHEAVKA